MNDSLSYERILKPPKGKAMFLPRFLLTLVYLTFLGIWLLIFLKWKFSAPLLVLAILSLLALILPTLKYGSVEYEYIFSGGMFYCAKIYGKRKRVQFAEIDLSRATLIAPNQEEYRRQAERLNPTEVIHATVDDKAEDIWLMVLSTPSDETVALFFHADERTTRILRKYNPRATVRIPYSHES